MNATRNMTGENMWARDLTKARFIRAKQVRGVQHLPLAAAMLAWRVIRTSLFVLLSLLEPAVRVICSVLMILGILAVAIFELSAVGPRFDFVAMIAMPLGFGASLIAYYGLLALLTPEPV